MNPRGAGSGPEVYEVGEVETLASIRAMRPEDYEKQINRNRQRILAARAEIAADKRRFWRQFKVILLILGLSAIIMLVGVWLI